jgi:Mn2+/Fe2+ NRAMP family transporter
MKLIIVLLSVTTVIAVLFSFKNAQVPFTFTFLSDDNLPFLIALMGWMPAPLDISVWHSVWSVEKEKTTGNSVSIKESMQDFNTGYWGTMILAILFVVLGANTLYSQGVEPAAGATPFANQLITIYTQTIGSWAYYIIAIAALTTMFSTTLTCFDAYPRVLASSLQILVKKQIKLQLGYWFWLIILYAGTVLVLGYCLNNMREFIDFVTIVSFLTAPVFALFNYIVVFYKLDKSQQPSNLMRWLSFAGMIYLLGFGIYYLIY